MFNMAYVELAAPAAAEAELPIIGQRCTSTASLHPGEDSSPPYYPEYEKLAYLASANEMMMNNHLQRDRAAENCSSFSENEEQEAADEEQQQNELKTKPIMMNNNHQRHYSKNGFDYRANHNNSSGHYSNHPHHHYYNLPLRNKVAGQMTNGKSAADHYYQQQQNIPVYDEGHEVKYQKMKTTVAAVQAELKQAKETLIALKNDKKKLKAEKFELLSQMKEVYSTLETKEAELREFIQQFEQKMLETDQGIKKLIIDKEKAEKDREEFAEVARQTSELLNLTKANLDLEQAETSKLRCQLKELQGRFALLTDRNLNAAENLHNLYANSSTKDNRIKVTGCEISEKVSGATVKPLIKCSSFDESQNRNDSTTDDKAGVQNDDVLRRRRQSTSKNRSGKNQSIAVTSPSKSENRLSKLFHLGRTKSKETASDCSSIPETNDNSSKDQISDDLCMAEKADKLVEARQMPIVRWRQAHVLAWLELELGMGQYAKIFAENVKSGRVLINLTNNELERSLKLTNPMHKKKLRLAIEEYRAPALWKFPLIKEVNTHFVCTTFLPSIGLSNYADLFRTNLIDGRIMNYLNKDQMVKYLNISKRFHQNSILKGIELLRLFDYDVKVIFCLIFCLLNKRRVACEKENEDLLVWTNARLSKWLRQIDLDEYVSNIENSGLHGAVTVLDAGFCAETFANVLKIPSHKKMIRKHLADEFDVLQQQSRNRILSDQTFKPKDYAVGRSIPKSLSSTKHFMRSNTADGHENSGFEGLANLKKRKGIRGSIVRAFGSKTENNDYEKVDSDFLFKFGDELATTKVQSAENFSKSDDTGHHNGEPSSAARHMSGSVGAGLDRSSATLSSTTSDLGSSIERSQHLKTILAPASQVLTQKPMTSNESTPKKCSGVKLAAANLFGSSSPLRRTGSSTTVKNGGGAEHSSGSTASSSFGNVLRASLFLRSNDHDRLVVDPQNKTRSDLWGRSPCSTSSSPAASSSNNNNNYVKMRRKKLGGNGDEKSSGGGDGGRSLGACKRPHSMGDFSIKSISPFFDHQLNDNQKSNEAKNVDHSLITYLVNKQLSKNWVSVENLHKNHMDSSEQKFESSASSNNEPPPSSNERRKIETIAECRELETSGEYQQSVKAADDNRSTDNNFPPFPCVSSSISAIDDVSPNRKIYEQCRNDSLLSRGGWRKRRARSVYSLTVTPTLREQTEFWPAENGNVDKTPQPLTFQVRTGLSEQTTATSCRQFDNQLFAILKAEHIWDGVAD
uniref:SAM domain-containing protein n=1 Tax=Romanomermis culicivorax TaxID=13658 RepID=A0A915I8I1_ROMCU